MKPISWEEFEALDRGQKITYIAGSDQDHIEATTTVASLPGNTSVYAHAEEIKEKGSNVKRVVGDTILAGRTELFKLNTH